MSRRVENPELDNILTGVGIGYELAKKILHLVKDAGGNVKRLLKMGEDHDDGILAEQIRIILAHPMAVAMPLERLVFRVDLRVKDRSTLWAMMEINGKKGGVVDDVFNYFPSPVTTRRPRHVIVRMAPVMLNFLGITNSEDGFCSALEYHQAIMIGLQEAHLELITFDDFIAFAGQHWWVAEQCSLTYPHPDLAINLYSEAPKYRTARIDRIREGARYRNISGICYCPVYVAD